MLVPAAEPEASSHQCSHVLMTIPSVVCLCHISDIYIKWAAVSAEYQKWWTTALYRASSYPPPSSCERQTTNKWITPAVLFHGDCAAGSWRAFTIATQTNLISVTCVQDVRFQKNKISSLQLILFHQDHRDKKKKCILYIEIKHWCKTTELHTTVTCCTENNFGEHPWDEGNCVHQLKLWVCYPDNRLWNSPEPWGISPW